MVVVVDDDPGVLVVVDPGVVEDPGLAGAAAGAGVLATVVLGVSDGAAAVPLAATSV